MYIHILAKSLRAGDKLKFCEDFDIIEVDNEDAHRVVATLRDCRGGVATRSYERDHVVCIVAETASSTTRS